MAVKIKVEKQFTEMPVAGGGVILVRAEGDELARLTAARFQELKAARGMKPDDPTAFDIVMAVANETATAEGLATQLIAMPDSPFIASDKAALAAFGVGKLAALATKYSGVSIEEWQKVTSECAIGQSFGGFRNFVDEDGNPVSDKNPDGSLNVEMCTALLQLDEVFDAYMTGKGRLNRARNERWGGVQKNS